MKRYHPSLAQLGLLIGVAYWVLESALHAWVFDNGSFYETLLGEHDPNELWMRTLATGLLVAFGIASGKVLQNERHEKERALKLTRLFQYIHQVSRNVGDRFQRPESHVELEPFDETLLDETEIGRIVTAVQSLSRYLDSRIDELYAILNLSHEINKGLFVDEVLDRIYETFRSVIPYDRIGVALLHDDGKMLKSRWMRSDYGGTKIPLGYSAPMPGSSLQRIIETGEPRIITDLNAYLQEHPHSVSSRLIVEEGIRSSLTCPLVAVGKPIGFIFFSSRRTGAYQHVHSNVFKLIAGQLSVVIEKSHTYEQLIAEKETSETLLLNVMPHRIIARIKAGIRNPVEEFTEVGVLFADIVGFTEIAHRCSAENVVQFLQDIFTQFDRLCEQHGVEKIKTIGDAYMVSTGVTSAEQCGLQSLAAFALDMLAIAGSIHCPGGMPLQVRVGIHTGPVIAGVIGQKKFAYDMWGDTVNVAQRLESTGRPGHVHVTERVYVLLRDDFAFEPRGTIDLKGEGPMTTYFMTRKPD